MSVGNIASPVSGLFGSATGKGASKAENAIASSQADFMKSLQQDFGTAFAGNQNIINSLTRAAKNIVAAGPSQFGFAAPEATALKTMATTGTAAATRNAMKIAAEQGAAGGVSANLPTGAAGARAAEIAQQGGENLSQQLLGIQEAGYQAGRQNYDTALKTMEAAGQLENPTGIASAANTAGADAFSSAKTIQDQNQAANPWTQVGGLVGSLAGAALNMVAPGAGTAMSKIGGLAMPKLPTGLGGTTAPVDFGGMDTSGFGPTLQGLDTSLFNTNYNVTGPSSTGTTQIPYFLQNPNG